LEETSQRFSQKFSLWKRTLPLAEKMTFFYQNQAVSKFQISFQIFKNLEKKLGNEN